MDVKTCSPFSLSADELAHVATLDWVDLAYRYSSEIWTYVAGYKLVLTLAASFGVVASLACGKYRAVLVLVLLGAAYFMLLYLFHLTCMGAYYFETLNSIPSFTRVPLQMFHALGLVMLFDIALRYAAGAKGGFRDRISKLWRSPLTVGIFVMLLIALMGWQGRQVNRSVVDMTTRAYQNVDPRIDEMRAAASRIEALRGTALSKRPVLTIISQGGDVAVLSYARFFAMGHEGGRIDPRFTVSNGFSWLPDPGNLWQEKASHEQLIQQLSEADIIWPITLDLWIMKALAPLVPDASCLKALPDKALVRDADDGEAPRFRCIDKQDA